MRRVARTEQLRRSIRQEVGIFKTVPPPVGGWNVRDPLAAMDPRDAITLENWFPRMADVVIRGGSDEWLDTVDGDVQALLVYNGLTASEMFAATDTGIYDATLAGTAGASVATSTDGQWQYVNMGTTAGNFMLCANGADDMLRYDGTSWTNPAITGITRSTVINLAVYKRRLFLAQGGHLGFWYLGVDVVAGALSEFSLGPVVSKGGYTVALGSWSLDAGAGPDDYFVAVTSQGEVVIYTGTNPADATAWSLVGVYSLGKPLGKRCLLKFGGDLLYLCENGVVPLSQVLRSASIERVVAITRKIEGAFTVQARVSGGFNGWMGVQYPAQNALVFNVPTISLTASEQYVMNTVTKSWCKFTGWNAFCIAEFNKELYFGTAGSVVKAWTGVSDVGGVDIVAYAKTAYNYFSLPGEEKQFKLMRPMLLVDGNIDFSLGLSVDFKQEGALTPASYTVVSGGIWDTSLWDDPSAIWGAGLEIFKEWRTVAETPGYCAAGLLSISTNQYEVQWAANDYYFEVCRGTPLG